MAALAEWLTIGELAARSGVAPSALRFYEARGLIAASRSDGNHRRFSRATLRRVAVIRAAQAVGLTLDQVGAALDTLPNGRTPTKRDWERLSRSWRRRLNRQIEDLEQLRDDLSGCIGCGCLTLNRCGLLNPGDRASARGAGARYLIGDSPIAAA